MIHHIDYNKMNSSIANLVSLCHSCHSKTNFNRERWLDYFKDRFTRHVSIVYNKIINI